MILSDTDIKEAIKKKEITISPFSKEHLKPGSYTLTLGQTLLKPKSKEIVEAKKPKIEYKKIKIPKTGFIIKPGEFYLGHTKEKVSISTKYACILDTRTTLARIGLTVLQGSTFIEPGQTESHETLEIANISTKPIKVYPDLKVVKCVFLELKSKSRKNYSKIGTYKKQKKF